MKCSSCGAQIDAGLRFCPSCGTPAAQARFCNQCGATVAAGAAFCPSCGAKAGLAPSQAKKGGSGGSATLVAALVVLVLAIFGGGGYYAWSKLGTGSQPSPGATTTPQATKASVQGTATAVVTAAASPQATKVATSTPKATARATATKSPGTVSGSDLGGDWEGTLVLDSLSFEGLTADEEEEITTSFEDELQGQEQPFLMTFDPTSSTAGTVILDSDGDALDPVSYKYQNGQVSLTTTSEGVEFELIGRVSRSGGDTVLEGTVKATATDGEKTVIMEGSFSVTQQ